MPRPARLLLPLLAILLAVQACAGAQVIQGKVVKIGDGDTITILVNGRQEVRVRLHGIDCPESAQAWGARAKQFTGSAAHDKQVQVEVRDTDRYGRTVGLVRIENQRKTLNEQLVDAGLAWAFRRYSTQFVSNEDRARAARRGLWSDPSPIPPWDFRKPTRP